MGGEQTILVVDDDPSIRLLCRVNLELEGYHVLEAYDVDGAVANAPDADLVLLDLHLGRVKGLEIVEPVRAAAPNTPLVLLTGSVDVDRALRETVSEVITKPFTIDMLLETTRRFATPVA